MGLGPTALPMEYYFVPGEFFLPDWYRNIRGFDVRLWDEMELDRVYSDASKAFALMPEPDDGPNLFIRILQFLFWVVLAILLPIPFVLLCIFIVSRKRGRGLESKDGEREEEDGDLENDTGSCSPENLPSEGHSE